MLKYHGRELFCESVALSHIADKHGTPTYVYSLSQLRRNADSFLSAAEPLERDCLICYAVKANGNPALLQILAGLGFGADIVSGGELFLALRSGFDPKRIVFSGVGKTSQEISDAISAGIHALHVESEDEQFQISRIAQSLGKIAPVAVRVNPDIGVETHDHVATGQKNHKFGLEPGLALEMMRAAQEDPWLDPIGLSAHLGSQLASTEPFRQLADMLRSLADQLSEDGLELQYLDLGGGLAIDYDRVITAGESEPADLSPRPSVAEWFGVLGQAVRDSRYRLLVEPGRSVVGSAGLLLTRILYTKNQAGRRMIVADAGMTDLVRPALYGARHPIVPVVRAKAADADQVSLLDVAGPVCESADFLARAVPLPALKPGDLLALLQAGAYGFAMSSNYNGRPRPEEVLVEGSNVRCIRQRESYDDLLGKGPPT